MNTDKSVQADERTLAIVNASNAWVLTFILFALLIDVVCRGVFFHEQAWDLLALVCVPGLVGMIYQAHKKIWGRSIWKARLICAVVTAIVTAVIAAIFAITKIM